MQEIRLSDGTHFTITESAADPDRDPVEIVMTIPAGATTPPLHVHPTQTDEFEMLSGTLEVKVDGRWRTLREGDPLVVPPATPHAIRKRGGETAVVRNVHPPSGSFDRFLVRLGALTESGELRRIRSPRGLLTMALLFREHEDAQRLANPVARVAFAALARVAPLLGVRLPG